MIQRLIFLMVLCAIAAPAAFSAEAKKTPPPVVQIQKKPPRPTEEVYLDGLASLNAGDTGGASVALASISPVLPYAKLLRAQIAAANQDFDTPLRLLIPLQAESGLLPQAYASLHATLALAYESQENVLGAAEQRVKAEFFLEPSAVGDNQSQIYKLLSSQPREILVELRGESPDPVVQGWVDLALALTYPDRKVRNIEQWHGAYPDHPASAELLSKLADKPSSPQVTDALVVAGKIALLLPLENSAYASVAKIVQAGVMAALAADAGKPEVVTYATGGADGVVSLYQRAVAEGATFVVGPLIRDEVTQLAAENLSVPVLALNQPEGTVKSQPGLVIFGLQVESEARQVAHLARSHGMQSALIVVAATPLAERMAKAFADEWRAQDGTVSAQLALPEQDKRGEFKAEAAQKSADMIFLAANAPQAQEIRPWLSAAIPTYGTSHLYDGAAKSIRNQDMLAVHFVDVPWLVEPDHPEFAALRPTEPLGSAEQQRLYALGLDAFRLAAVLANPPAVGKQVLEGATGNIYMQENNVLTRELTPAQFRREGVEPEFVD